MSQPKSYKSRLHEIIFEADTLAGKLFDLILLGLIVASITIVMLDSVPSYREQYGERFDTWEWILTGLFSLEYIARILALNKPLKYVFSFYGLVDLLSILPSYLGIFIGGGQSSLSTIRALRLLRIFRILKLGRFLKEASVLQSALLASRAKILVFLFAVLTIVMIMGTVMYLVEGAENGFTSIPRSIYWAIVTLTTVGYGDIAPGTPVGQFLASVLMIMGFAIIAVPTGIVSSELARAKVNLNTQSCPSCSREGHDDDADHCKYCGERNYENYHIYRWCC